MHLVKFEPNPDLQREATLNAELGRKVPSASRELISDEQVGWLTVHQLSN